MHPNCLKCESRCCRYYCFQIDTPESYDEFEDIRWYLCHEGVTVHIDEEGDWYISIANRCAKLGPDDRCTIYEERPLICRTYDPSGCDRTGGDYCYEQEFTTPEQLEEYARETLGKKKFDKPRQAKREKLDKKARKKARKLEAAKRKDD